MMHRIVQRCNWHCKGKPMLEQKIIGTFATKWLARWHRWWHYVIAADPAWKMTFRWDIEPI